MDTALFALGETYITVGALQTCASYPMPPIVLLIRHVTGDWRELGEGDRKRNEEAILTGTRVFSAYQLGEDRFFVITEADRSKTTILLAHEY